MVPDDVCAAFGLTGVPEELAGGMSPVFRFGDVVVKTVDDHAEATMIADVMSVVDVDATLVRVARPVRAADGAWVAAGWTAWRWEAGQVQQKSLSPGLMHSRL
jgi:hypothetical protein